MAPSKYYLVHAIIDPNSDKILKILSDGYLHSSSKSGYSGLYNEPLDYVYFSLLGDSNKVLGHNGITLIFDTDILFKRPFRYALRWIGNDIDKSTKVDFHSDDVSKILYKINQHIIDIEPENPLKYTSHEILLKNQVKLDHLIAICCLDNLSIDIIAYIKSIYPKIKILKKFPESAQELDKIINYHKYIKYKTKYLKLKNHKKSIL